MIQWKEVGRLRMMIWNLPWGGYKVDQGVRMSRLRIQDRALLVQVDNQDSDQNGQVGILSWATLRQLVNHHINLHRQCSL